ncbi:hypothetical protein R1sor_008968 [Riccia sorocarpa]|uniref:Uncharacterized protein n=1 Tax=Riccia sorocarpa TaxID=122646 RepID=A0ABD3H8D6_9MARC
MGFVSHRSLTLADSQKDLTGSIGRDWKLVPVVFCVDSFQRGSLSQVARRESSLERPSRLTLATYGGDSTSRPSTRSVIRVPETGGSYKLSQKLIPDLAKVVLKLKRNIEDQAAESGHQTSSLVAKLEEQRLTVNAQHETTERIAATADKLEKQSLGIALQVKVFCGRSSSDSLLAGFLFVSLEICQITLLGFCALEINRNRNRKREAVDEQKEIILPMAAQGSVLEEVKKAVSSSDLGRELDKLREAVLDKSPVQTDSLQQVIADLDTRMQICVKNIGDYVRQVAARSFADVTRESQTAFVLEHDREKTAREARGLNLRVVGLQEEVEEDTKASILQLFQNTLHVATPRVEQAFRIGRSDKRPPSDGLFCIH